MNDQLIQQVTQILQQGAKPEEVIMGLLQQQIAPEDVIQILVQVGVPEQDAAQAVQAVMQQAQGQEQPQESAEAPQEEAQDPNEAQEMAEESIPEQAFGGPSKKEIFAMEKNMRKAFGGNLNVGPDKSNPESYVKDLQASFAAHVAKNNMQAMISNSFKNIGNEPQNFIPKADLGTPVQTTKPVDNTTYTKEQVEELLRRYTAKLQSDQTNFLKERRAMTPLGMMFNSFGQKDSGRKVIGHGQAAGFEEDFLKSGLTGKTKEGRAYQVSEVEKINRLFRPDITRYHITYDAQGNPVTPKENVSATNVSATNTVPTVGNEAVGLNPNDSPFMNQLTGSTPNFQFKETGFDNKTTVYPTLNTNVATPTNENVDLNKDYYPEEKNNKGWLRAILAKGVTDKQFKFGGNNNEAQDDSIDIYDQRKHPVDWQEFSQGVMGVMDQTASFVDRLNTGVDPAHINDNYAVEKVYGTKTAMDEGFYDQWGNFKPNERNAPLAGTGDQSAYTLQGSNFQGTQVSAKGGPIKINPKHKGDFTAKAKDYGMSVQAFAHMVLNAGIKKFDKQTLQQANFAINAAKWNKKALGGSSQEVPGNDDEHIINLLSKAGYTVKKVN